MSDPATLSLEQNLELEVIKRKTSLMSEDECKAMLLNVHIQIVYMDARYQRAIAERWGLNSSKSSTTANTPTGNTFSTSNVIDCGDAGHC